MVLDPACTLLMTSLHVVSCLWKVFGQHVVDAHLHLISETGLDSFLLPSLAFLGESSWSLLGLVFNGVIIEVSCNGSILKHFFAVTDWMKHRLGRMHVRTDR